MTKLALGLDLGGSSVKWGVVTPYGEMVEKDRVEIQDRAPKFVMGILGSIISRNLKKYGDSIVGVGAGSPGLVDKSRKIVRLSPNFPLWDNVEIVKNLKSFSNGLNVTFENDANLLVYSETRWGAAVNCKNVVVLTLGTGVGGGVMVDGKVLRGVGGGAAELGHIPLDVNGPKCGCGATGCFETFCNITGTMRMAHEIYPTEEIPANPAELTNAADHGDERAIEVWRRVGNYLGVGVAAIINIFNPEKLLVGGGLTNASDWLFEPAREMAKKRSYIPNFEDVYFGRAKLQDESGLLGAAALAFDENGVETFLKAEQ